MKEHEETERLHLEDLKEQIKRDGILKNPIIVDKNTNIILDGHTRLNSLKGLGYSKIAVYFVDYESPEIFVESWGDGKITKEKVIKAGLTGNKLPPKTSKHMFRKEKISVHISEITKRINIPLKVLK